MSKVRIVNGEVVREPASAMQRTGGSRPMAGLHSPSTQTPSSASTSQPRPAAPAPPAGNFVEVELEALRTFEQQLGLVGQYVEVPPVQFAGWSRPTRIRTVVIAGIIGAALLANLAGMPAGRIAIISLLVLAGYIHVQQTGVAPQAPPRRH